MILKEIKDLFTQKLKVVNIGTSKFKEDLDLQSCESVQVEWKPPAGGNPELINALDFIQADKRTEEANKQAVSIMKEAHPHLVDIDLAVNVIPGMHARKILHAGPPIKWEDMCGPMQGAVVGALMYEGLAECYEDARMLAESGEIEFSPCNENSAVGPMAGVVSANMPVHVVKNIVHGNYAFCTINEGLGKVLRFGAYSEEVIGRLKWLKEVYAPALKEALSLSEGIDLKAITSQALNMGDECHNRNKASTLLFYKEISNLFLNTSLSKEKIGEVLKFIRENEHYYLNLSMPSCKVTLDAAHGIPFSTVVTTMARNGVEFGIRISGLGKQDWFTAPANYVKGLFFPGFSEDDAAPDLGDSSITETMGIGGFAMAGSPAIVQFVGGNVSDAINLSEQMYNITLEENTNYSIPSLDFRGSALGIDICKVIDTGILPVINTGMAHKEAGIGQVGAGIVNPPKECFEKALIAFHNNYKER